MTASERPKVAHLTTVDTSLRYLLLPQLRAAVDAGYDVIGISAPGPDVPILEAAGIRHIAVPSSTRAMNPVADVRAAVGLWRILRDEHIDVLHTHNPKPGLYGRILGRLAGVPVVVNTLHGVYPGPDARPVVRWLGYAAELLAARFSHAELVQNSEDLERLSRFAVYPRRRARLLGNGVDLERFRPGRLDAAQRRATRHTLGVADDELLVGCVGRLVREKGYPELFEAARLLGRRCAVIAIGPDDPDKADALSPAEIDAARAAGVRLLGMRTDVEELYAAMDVFVLPSHREGFPRAAMEAAATGIPVVATDIRGNRQVVDDGVMGLLVPVGEPEALAAAVASLADHARRGTMGREARRRAEALFDEDAIVKTVLDEYRTQLAVAPRARRTTTQALALAAKRGIDLAGAGIVLVLFSPLLLAIGVLIRFRMGRPVLFRQSRPGLRGRIFTIYKFRTMTECSEPERSHLTDAERLTPLGRLLRATSLDELPELVNVLRGDMSLVGPRPLLVEYLGRYTPEQMRRHAVRPGITGWAQVRGRNDLSWRERFALDLWYVDHWSLVLDLRILASTMSAVLRRRGISAAGHATMPRFEGSPR